MQIKPVRALKDNYIWTIINDDKKHAIIVDPGSAQEILQFLKQYHLQLVAILITHHHWDHTNGIQDIKVIFPDVEVYGPKHKHIAGVTHKVSEGDQLFFPDFNLQLQVFDIPGHTLSHIAYYNERILFSGDTLFSAGCGRLFEGTSEQMVSSLKKLMSLPNDIAVYCGHEYTLNNLRFAETVEPDNPKIAERKAWAEDRISQSLPSLPSTMAIEKALNPFLRVNAPAIQKSAATYANQTLHDPIQVFTVLRQWKDVF